MFIFLSDVGFNTDYGWAVYFKGNCVCYVDRCFHVSEPHTVSLSFACFQYELANVCWVCTVLKLGFVLFLPHVYGKLIYPSPRGTRITGMLLLGILCNRKTLHNVFLKGRCKISKAYISTSIKWIFVLNDRLTLWYWIYGFI